MSKFNADEEDSQDNELKDADFAEMEKMAKQIEDDVDCDGDE